SYGGGRSLWRRKPAFRALEPLDISINEGETLVVLGESGSGKTTLGRALLALTPYAGGVSWRERRIDDLPARELRRLRPGFQMIFQDPYASLNPARSIGSALIEPLLVHGLARDKAA